MSCLLQAHVRGSSSKSGGKACPPRNVFWLENLTPRQKKLHGLARIGKIAAMDEELDQDVHDDASHPLNGPRCEEIKIYTSINRSIKV